MGSEKVGVDFAEIDIEKLEKVRKGLPSLEHLRNDIYCLSKLWWNKEPQSYVESEGVLMDENTIISPK